MPVERKLKAKQIEIDRVPASIKQTVSVHFERNSNKSIINIQNIITVHKILPMSHRYNII